MQVDDEIVQINQKIESLEDEIKKIHTTLHEYEMVDVKLTQSIQSLEAQLLGIKQDVIKTVEDNSRRTWELINKGIKIIIILVSFICLLAGIKIAPDLLKALGGM